MRISISQLKKVMPNLKDSENWIILLNDYLPLYEINSATRISAFLAQTGHESGDYSRLSENMNYSAAGLRNTFGRYFKTDKIAAEYARQPEKIANYVYADVNRTNKLGNTQPGDGWRFRGAGLIQLTGRWNVTAFATDVGMTPEQAADYLRTPRGAVHSACWFWKRNNLNAFADRGDQIGLTRAINGGTIGLADRQARYTRALPALATSSSPTRSLGIGSRGYDVTAVQRALGAVADGIFGKNTAAAVASWQKSQGCAANGTITAEQQIRLLA